MVYLIHRGNILNNLMQEYKSFVSVMVHSNTLTVLETETQNRYNFILCNGFSWTSHLSTKKQCDRRRQQRLLINFFSRVSSTDILSKGLLSTSSFIPRIHCRRKQLNVVLRFMATLSIPWTNDLSFWQYKQGLREDQIIKSAVTTAIILIVKLDINAAG